MKKSRIGLYLLLLAGVLGWGLWAVVPEPEAMVEARIAKPASKEEPAERASKPEVWEEVAESQVVVIGEMVEVSDTTWRKVVDPATFSR